MLARALYEEGAGFATAFNFGPPTDRHLPVRSIVEQMIAFWGDGASWQDCSNPDAPHEAGMLVLDPTRARHRLGWVPEEDITRSIAVSVDWYKAFTGASERAICNN